MGGIRLNGAFALLCALAAAFGCVGCTAPHEVADWTLREASGRAARPITLPSHLDDGSLARDSTYTLVTTHTLAPDFIGRDVDFVIPHFWAITRLTVDGQPAVRVRGPLHRTYRETGPHVYRIPAATTRDGKLRLELAVDHTWTQSAWFDVVPRLVRTGERDTAAMLSEFFNVTLGIYGFATLLQIGLACLAIYFIGGRRRMYLWFGIQAVTAASYPLLTHGSLPVAFGHYDVPFTATALVIAIWASLRFSYDFFELGHVPRAWDRWMAVAALICAYPSGPYLSTQIAGRTAIAIVALGVVLQSRLCIQQTLIAAKRRDARWYLACWMALALTTWNEMVTWAGLGEVFSGARIACMGLTFFAFFLSLLLSQRHMGTLEQSDRLNAELAERVHDLERRGGEIEQLNTELRRQIAERAEQIYAALALRDRRGAPPPVLQTGEVVQGRYRVASLLGTGGMGAVYEVARLLDGERFALKLTRETHGEALALLAREAQIAAQLSHPNVVKVVDVDISSTGFLFVIMELVDGRPLSELRPRYGDLPWALMVLQQMAAGLAVLHQADIVHRDVKPPNVLISEWTDVARLRVKITDFGISRFEPDSVYVSVPPPAPPLESTWRSVRAALAEGCESDTVVLTPDKEAAEPAEGESPALSEGLFTRGGFIAGTPTYMAPELAIPGARATSAADLYSFGIVAWELLTGARPCLRPAAMAVMQGEAPDAIPSLASALQPADAELVQFIDDCLALEPKLRPSASQVEQALAAVSARRAAQGGAAISRRKTS